MTHVFKLLVILIFITAASACGVNPKKHQTVAPPHQPDKKHTIHVSFNFDTGDDQGNRIAGFRLYKEGKLICETKDSKSNRIDCDIASPGGSFLFTMTTYFEDGSESRHSEPFSYTIPD